LSVIVTDARYRMSLSVIRSLGEAGLRVIATEELGTSPVDALGFHSRFASEKLFIHSSRTSPDSFIQDLLSLGKKGDVLVPVSLSSILAVAGRIAEVRERFHVALPSLEAIQTANDTDRLLKVATGIGLRVPRTEQAAPGVDPSSLISRLRFPVVVKYREGEALALPPERRYAIVEDESRFAAVYSRMAAIQASPLVQEYIRGDGWGMSAVLDASSKPAMVFCHRRIREYPVTGGPSCFCESVRDERLIEMSLHLLQELKWYGVAMVEWKRESATGDYVLMEVNPRFWGSLPLSAAAGLNFPEALCRVAMGEDAGSPPPYKIGVRMRYLFQDLLSVRGYLRRVPNKAAFLVGFVKDLFDPRVVDGVFRLNDPLPGLFYLARALGKRNT